VVVITAGIPLGISGTTNMLKVQLVGNVLVSGTGVGNKTVCGNLCVCRDEEEVQKIFKEGEILVVPGVSCETITTLRHAAGIICEKDGVESTAAIVGQALNIPVIVGAVNATKILKSGTVVTLDAARGTVLSGDVDK